MITFLSVSFFCPGDFSVFTGLFKRSLVQTHTMNTFCPISQGCQKAAEKLHEELSGSHQVLEEGTPELQALSWVMTRLLYHSSLLVEALLPLLFSLSCSMQQQVRVGPVSLVHSPLVPSPCESPSQLHSPSGQPAVGPSFFQDCLLQMCSKPCSSTARAEGGTVWRCQCSSAPSPHHRHHHQPLLSDWEYIPAVLSNIISQLYKNGRHPPSLSPVKVEWSWYKAQ